MKNITIRDFIFPQDYATVLSLWQTAGKGIHIARSDEINEIAKKLTRDPDLFLVAEADGLIIGAVLGGFDGRRGIMYHLAVSEPFRSRGVASSLTKELEHRFQQKGCLKIYLLVYEDNLQAIQFYEKREYYKMDLLIYGKDLL